LFGFAGGFKPAGVISIGVDGNCLMSCGLLFCRFGKAFGLFGGCREDCHPPLRHVGCDARTAAKITRFPVGDDGNRPANANHSSSLEFFPRLIVLPMAISLCRVACCVAALGKHLGCLASAGRIAILPYGMWDAMQERRRK
jgi:hypothetical protein